MLPSVHYDGLARDVVANSVGSVYSSGTNLHSRESVAAQELLRNVNVKDGRQEHAGNPTCE